jgi:hypothetical protein
MRVKKIYQTQSKRAKGPKDRAEGQAM